MFGNGFLLGSIDCPRAISYISFMSLFSQSLISSNQLNTSQITEIFQIAQFLKKEFELKKQLHHLVSEGLTGKTVALVFSEPSTRTRTSFQMAALRLGLRVVLLDNPSVTSVQKGETLADTLKNMAATLPDAIVVRYGVDKEADECLTQLGCPVINAGIGTREHPTQALLDTFTIFESRGKVKDERVLIVGDVLHSRVANSNLIMLKELGADIAYCAPEEFVPRQEAWSGVRCFSDLNEGIAWASVVMCLRIQKERHGQQGIGLTVAEYREKYRVGGDNLKHLRDDGILLHPGPVNRGVEISNYAMNDSRCRVLTQVTNGVFVRAALISQILGLGVRTL